MRHAHFLTLQAAVLGYWGDVGDGSSNLDLSKRRADAVLSELAHPHKDAQAAVFAAGAFLSPAASNRHPSRLQFGLRMSLRCCRER